MKLNKFIIFVLVVSLLLGCFNFVDIVGGSGIDFVNEVYSYNDLVSFVVKSFRYVIDISCLLSCKFVGDLGVGRCGGRGSDKGVGCVNDRIIFMINFYYIWLLGVVMMLEVFIFCDILFIIKWRYWRYFILLVVIFMIYGMYIYYLPRGSISDDVVIYGVGYV